MKENFVKSVNSHLVMYDKPKVAVVNGFIERIFGMLFSQHIDGYGSIATNRTLLTGEELNPHWNTCSNDNDALDAVHYFNNFPKLTMKDVRNVIRLTIGTRYLFESFDELVELGCIVPQREGDIITMSVGGSQKEYNFYCKELGSISSQKCWIPSSIEYLYSIQSFLDRQIVLTRSKDSEIDQSTVDMMNELLKNQRDNKIFITGELSGTCYVNDGVHTYGTNGTKVAMTREEFIEKYPDSYETLG